MQILQAEKRPTFLILSPIKYVVALQATRQASKQAGKQLNGLASRQARKQADQAGKQVSKQSSRQALRGHSVGAMPCRGLLGIRKTFNKRV